MTQPRSLEVRVVEVIRETADAHSLVLEPAAGDRERFHYRPGQFLTVRVPTTREGGAARCYSLSSSPVCDEKPTVTVKRIRDGYASNWICDNVAEGDVLEVLAPAGEFTPASLDEDLLLLAGGSGITPIMSILKSCLRTGSGGVTLVYANRDENAVIFSDELAALASQYPGRLTTIHWLESLQGTPTAPAVQELCAPYAGRQVFTCGPEAFVALVGEALANLDVPAERVHTERFFSLAGDPFADSGRPVAASEPSGTVEVELDGAHHTVSWPQNNRLLDVLLEAGLDVPFSCREGACSACACVLREGEVAMANNEVLDKDDLADGLILACQATPLTHQTKVSYDG